MNGSVLLRSSLFCGTRLVRNYSKVKDVKAGSSKYVQPAKGVKMVFANSMSKFVEAYERLLKKRFPKVYKIYKLFITGTKDLYQDVKEYMEISSQLSGGKKVRELSYDQLIKYYETPKSLFKVAPTLVLSLFPFGNYVVFPLAIMYPRLLLSSHFWTPEQRFNYQLEDYTSRISHNKLLFSEFKHGLEPRPQLIRIKKDKEDLLDCRQKCKQIIDKLADGSHPSPSELLSVRPIFTEKPFGINYLHDSHLRLLCSIHGLSRLPRKRWRLANYADFLHELDLSISRAGGPESLNTETIEKACFTRGLNPYGLDRDSLESWLHNWLTISTNLNGKCLSLLFHCPLFLGLNCSSNLKLLSIVASKNSNAN